VTGASPSRQGFERGGASTAATTAHVIKRAEPCVEQDLARRPTAKRGGPKPQRPVGGKK
jgi:hypothetical protein